MIQHRALRLFVPAFVVALSIASAFAQAAGDIQVRAIVKRPKCDLVEAQVEVYNKNPGLYYKVRVEGNIGNEEMGPQYCMPSESPCISSFSTDLTLSLCDDSGYCAATSGGLPLCTSHCTEQCPTCQTCDNRVTGSGSCPATCDQSTEWCADFKDLRVKIIGYSEDGVNWTSDDTVVCVRGSYGDDPSCIQESYCDSTITRSLCSFSGPVCVASRP